MGELSQEAKAVARTLDDDQAWQGVQKRYGPNRLAAACRELIGMLVDEHRQALRELAGAALVVWLAEHRRVRGRVEVRLAEVLGVPTVEAAALVGKPEVLQLVHQVLDAAAAGLPMQATLRRLRITRSGLQKALELTGVPLPWPAGGRGTGVEVYVQRSVAAFNALLERLGLDAGSGETLMVSPFDPTRRQQQ